MNPPLAYGQSQPLVEVMPMVQEIAGVPTVQTRGVLGQMLLNSLSAGDIYMLTGIIAGLAQWTLVAGGAGNFNSLTVTTFITAGTTITAGTNITSTTGNITATLGNIVATAGNIGAGGDIGAVGNIVSTAGQIIGETGASAVTGDVTAVAGNVIAETNVIANTGYVVSLAGSLVAGGDTGAFGPTDLVVTNTVDNTQGAGALTLLSANGNAGTNTGFLSFWRGGVRVYVPYFLDITP